MCSCGAGPTGPGFKEDTDRLTNILAFKVSHVFPFAGGLDTSFKWKYVRDEDTADVLTTADDRETRDNGYSVSAGKQLFSQREQEFGFARGEQFPAALPRQPPQLSRAPAVGGHRLSEKALGLPRNGRGRASAQDVIHVPGPV